MTDSLGRKRKLADSFIPCNKRRQLKTSKAFEKISGAQIRPCFSFRIPYFSHIECMDPAQFAGAY